MNWDSQLFNVTGSGAASPSPAFPKLLGKMRSEVSGWGGRPNSQSNLRYLNLFGRANPVGKALGVVLKDKLH